MAGYASEEPPGPGPSRSGIAPGHCVALLVDPQPGLYVAAQSRDHAQLAAGLTALARLIRLHQVPAVLTTSASAVFGGPPLNGIADGLGDPTVHERAVIDAWQDDAVRAAVTGTGRRTLLVAGVFTEACVTFPVLGALADGYRVAVVVDSCAGLTAETHASALARMQQAGAVQVTWPQLLLEWQVSWVPTGGHTDTYSGSTALLREFAPSYGLALQHARYLREQGARAGAGSAAADPDHVPAPAG